MLQPIGRIAIGPRTGERRQQRIHIRAERPFAVKIKPAQAHRIGTQKMFALIRRLHGRIGKAETQAAQKHSQRGAGVEVFHKPNHQPGRQHHCQRQRTHSQRHGNRRHRVKAVKYAPIIDHTNPAHHGGQRRQAPAQCAVQVQHLRFFTVLLHQILQKVFLK